MSRYKSTNNSLKSHLSTSSLPKEEVNIVLLGKQTVGKSALVVKYLTKRFIREYDPFLEDTYWKPDVVDQQEVLVKVMDTYGKDEKRLPYYLKWADAVLITYSITQQDSFEMALAYLDAINTYSKNLTVSTNELVIILLGNKLDLERTRVVLKSEGESTAVKFSCAFCETTAADDYEYVQQLFHRTVREVRKERERTLISNAIVEEPIAAEISSNTSFPSPPSSRSSNSSVHFSIPNETEKISPSTIPLPPPMPATLAHKAARAATAMKPESQPLINSSNTSSSLSSLNKTGSLPSVGSLTTLSSTTTSNPSSISSSTKRTSSKTSSVFSKIFK
ncbi:unnamed protein product [Rotaria magnacalcarata]|uniref:small monomeric GTPase n=1 Tax=Rotaria magnacalcarata TaxID=392030 RepID=A0A817ACK0_9BILA|nr:unnamed protein product [Rotaria magnacalcarata]CAF1444050.1 unnamed protein product [Rotaria magnacalcarata]CAF1935254.1 unnamed protein product [Rotaria magnacalcarata]CAF2088265.1 unnamed protein product [Rotaria magnacalcarata]CAF2254193.1 unnamed protein product [Rotaria magnacalcarata]